MRDDDVNGVIVGGDFKSGALYYNGRMQGQPVHENSEELLIKRLTDDMRRMIADCGAAVDHIYPSNDAWEIRIYD